MLSNLETTRLSVVRNLVQESFSVSQLHAVEFAVCPSSFSSVFDRPDLGNSCMHNARKYQRMWLLLQLQRKMQNTLSPSLATPSDTDYSHFLTLYFRPQKSPFQINFGTISTALLDEHAPPSDLADYHHLLLSLQPHRGTGRSSQGPQDSRRLCRSIHRCINLFPWPHSASALPQN